MDYHKILGVPKNASESEMKRAYRRKAMELHPDKNKSADAEEKFVELTVAYDVLVNGKVIKSKAATQPSAHEKYKNVYTAPHDPEEYKEWLNVARERTRRQAKMEFETFRKNNKAFRRSQYFPLAKAFSIFLMFIGFAISAFIFFAPLIFGMEHGIGLVIFMAVFICPIGIWIFIHVLQFKKEFEKYFLD